MASRSIEDLDWRLKPLAKKFLDECATAGLEAILIQTYRSNAEQDALYEQSRDGSGRPWATDHKGGESPHNCTTVDGKPAARAFDFALYAPGSKTLDWNADDDQWQMAIGIGQELGLVSGSSYGDHDHFELPGWRFLS